MRSEDISRLLDHFGPYQRRLFLLLLCPLMMIGYTTMMVVVTFYTPEHRCQVPELPNDTFAIQGESHLMVVNRSVPVEVASGGEERFSQCLLYANRSVSRNTTGSDVTENCKAWVYDKNEFDNTIATQFDVVCEKKSFRANHNMIFMLGKLVGAPIVGFLCDRCLRYVANISMGGMLQVWKEAYGDHLFYKYYNTQRGHGVLLVYRFFSSMTSTSVFISTYVLSLEIMGPSHRNLSGSLVMLLWLTGCFLVAGISYGIRDWVYIQILSGAPFVLFLGNFWLIPESPLWLHSKNRVQEAKDIVKKIFGYNNIPLPEELDKADGEQANGKAFTNGDLKDQKENPLLEGSEERGQDEGQKKVDEVQQDEAHKHESLLALLKYPNLIIRTAIMWFNWAVVNMMYYGLSLNVSNLAGSVRLNFLLSNSVELIGYSLAWILLDRLGRKRVHCAVMLMAGSACLGTIFTVAFGGQELQWATTVLAMIGKLGISAAFSSVFLMTAELFPTVVRNLGMGCAATVGRVGSAVSPYIADMGLYFGGRLAQALPLIVFGSLALAAGLLSLLLPETLNRKLPDTLLEAANFDKKKTYPVLEMEVKPPATKQNQDSQDDEV